MIIVKYTVNLVVKAWNDTSVHPRSVTEDVLQCLYATQFYLACPPLTIPQLPPRVPRPQLCDPARDAAVHEVLGSRLRQQAARNYLALEQGVRAQSQQRPLGWQSW